MQNDPEYLGIKARDRLDLMKEGETILRVDPPSNRPALTPEAPLPLRVTPDLAAEPIAGTPGMSACPAKSQAAYPSPVPDGARSC